MTHRVILSLEAEEQLVGLYRYIARRSSAAIAKRFTDDIVAYCDRLSIFPERGTLRPDLGEGLRLIGFRRRVAILFEVRPGLVTIAGVFYGGVDISAKRALAADD